VIGKTFGGVVIFPAVSREGLEASFIALQAFSLSGAILWHYFFP
jgi:hypothetical protein